jgi:hypothetical protein
MNIVQFALKHLPNDEWVKLERGVHITTTKSICDATLAPIGPCLFDNLKYCSYQEDEYYGQNNKDKFKLVPINIKYTELGENYNEKES